MGNYSPKEKMKLNKAVFGQQTVKEQISMQLCLLCIG